MFDYLLVRAHEDGLLLVDLEALKVAKLTDRATC